MLQHSEANTTATQDTQVRLLRWLGISSASERASECVREQTALPV